MVRPASADDAVDAGDDGRGFGDWYRKENAECAAIFIAGS